MSSKEWIEEAIIYLEQYPQNEFKTEDVRVWAYGKGLSKPKHDRIWGAVIIEAANRGIVKRIGYRLVDNPKAHKTPAGFWRKL